MSNTTSTINQLSIQMAKIGEKVGNIEQNTARVEGGVTEINKKLEADYATKEWVDTKYQQTRNIINAILVTIGTAVIAATATFIIRGGLVK